MDKQSTVSPIFNDKPIIDEKSSANAVVATASAETNAGNGKRSIEWTARQIAMATLTALGVVFIFLLLYRFYMVVFIFFVAVTLQIGLRPAIAWLEKRGIR